VHHGDWHAAGLLLRPLPAAASAVAAAFPWN
jgi:hypothetical protein